MKSFSIFEQEDLTVAYPCFVDGSCRKGPQASWVSLPFLAMAVAFYAIKLKAASEENGRASSCADFCEGEQSSAS